MSRRPAEEPVTLQRRQELCAIKVTLDGDPARIAGYRNEYATVRTARGGAFEWAWQTADRIVRKDGAFRS